MGEEVEEDEDGDVERAQSVPDAASYGAPTHMQKHSVAVARRLEG